jgi:hypothetical protein
MNDALNILMNVLNFWLMVVAPHALPFAIGASLPTSAGTFPLYRGAWSSHSALCRWARA